MREIKFRAWYEAHWINNNLGKYGQLEKQWRMDKVHSLHLNKNKAMVSSATGVISLEIGDKCKIMQYTGLKDKYEIEMYDGDIVFNEVCDVYGKITCEEGAFWHERDGVVDLLSEWDMSLEVVGNIFENKNILGESN